MKNLLRCFIKRTYSINAVALLVAVSLLGDHLVSRIHQKHAVKAICDNSTHFLIGGISWLIVCINTSFLQNHTQCLLEILLCAFIAAVIDVDHFISAKSLSLKEATILKGRPFLHSSTVPVVICACFFMCDCLLKSAVLKRLSPIIFIAFSSHHIRDATRRGLWFSPFGSTIPIPYKLYISLNCVIPLVTFPTKPFHSGDFSSIYSSHRIIIDQSGKLMVLNKD
ncbi:LOW QUALITY PROTEIN: transmembrane protein 267 [Harmonia axyridis]|uniref:LOW QUALITY PROTEIN: transmembrane protein 267 n=1 Tax=Harmonia axyridis TaxID=115357 RepID=UPI001E277FBC|nr:LOW QUALITY PROTEIN: transmembrane protein 267 [Harmonia axyridis]